MKSDPFAPANSPRHVRNLGAAFRQPRAQDDAASTRLLHSTAHEQDADAYPDAEELQRRATLVEEYRQQLAEEGPDAEAPELEDVTGELYRWHEGDRVEGDPEESDGEPDGTTASGWRFAGEAQEDDGAGSLEIPPRNGPGSDTETWRTFAAAATLTEADAWATLNRGEIISTLERDGVIPNESA